MLETVEWVLTASDTCDAKECSAQAYVKTTGVSGELLFCNHHYNSIMDSVSGYDKMLNFAYTILDERDRLIENRLQGED